jgi:ribosomal protein L37AE/L43A
MRTGAQTVTPAAIGARILAVLRRLGVCPTCGAQVDVAKSGDGSWSWSCPSCGGKASGLPWQEPAIARERAA